MEQLFEGTISTKSILEAEKREALHLYIDRNKRTKDISYIIRLAKKKHIPVSFHERDELNTISESNKHGGVILRCKPRHAQNTLMLCEGLSVYINGVEDPYNLGSVCRSLYAAGCKQLILPKRDWSSAEPTILKASAGAYEKIQIAMIDTDQSLVEFVQENHIPLYCAHRKNAISLYTMDFPETCVIAIGGALRGLSSVIEKASNQNIYIEYGTDFRNALDTPSAASVFAFEYLRQRKDAS